MADDAARHVSQAKRFRTVARDTPDKVVGLADRRVTTPRAERIVERLGILALRLRRRPGRQAPGPVPEILRG